ncbi:MULTISPECIES: glycosyltransferase [Kitasatospora]|uniref:glycosyltransferase n=1 Tax=Kitasatospora TaxID=2063 RepID=UPI000C714BF1|nr:glycosyltransferase [Kitasatospora sp. GP30]MDH6140423.1 glycosyltransferase involved in cell wall biosynthesis [Kitasatospora sp. GP30]
MAGSERRPRVCVVGSGWRFTGGLSHYTCRLAGALAEHAEVSALLMRRLLPAFLYPGRKRVGVKVAAIDYDERVDVYDGVDWFWLPSLLTALRRLRRNRPDTIVFQWWTGTVAHTYLVLAVAARALGARVVVEFHEVQDTGEIRIPFVAGYTRWLLSALLRRSDAFLVHSAYDEELLRGLFDLSGRPVTVVSHGPFDHYAVERVPSTDGAFRLLFFGLIRPYKGLDLLISAFDRLSPEEIEGVRLTVVGETWEGCVEPIRMIENSPYRDRITLVNRYVSDEEAKAHFAAADALVLPYRRSSASGPLHIAMSNGLPVVLSSVGGLVEAVGDYPGAVLVPPEDVDALLEGLRKVVTMAGEHFSDPHSWERNVEAVIGTARAEGGER